MINYFKQHFHGIFVSGNTVCMKYICSMYANFLKGKLDKVKNNLNIRIIRYENGYQ